MKASCQCGRLTAEVPGPTAAVVACHCRACQKRSGAPFGVAAYWPHADVSITGEAQQFDRPTDAGGEFSQFFCPASGTTDYMRGTKNPAVTGIPIGLFDDPPALQPIRSVWEISRHPWVEIPTAHQHFAAARTD